MNKQTHSEETLKRTKGIIGDEDKHKSSTENPEKELIIQFCYSINEILNYIDKSNEHSNYKQNNFELFEIKLFVYAFLCEMYRYYKKILLTKFDYDFSGIQKA